MTKNMNLLRLMSLSVTLLGFAACSTGTMDKGTSSTPASNEATTTSHATLSDPQIAAIVVAANTVDVDAAKQAKGKTKNKAVRAFANDMIRDHGGNNKAAGALVKKLNVTPEPTDASRGLLDSGKSMRDSLKTKKGADFDKAYVSNEVSYHEAVLKTIDDALVPSAKNAELKDLLLKTRPVVAEHLEHAKMLQAKMH